MASSGVSNHFEFSHHSHIAVPLGCQQCPSPTGTYFFAGDEHGAFCSKNTRPRNTSSLRGSLKLVNSDWASDQFFFQERPGNSYCIGFISLWRCQKLRHGSIGGLIPHDERRLKRLPPITHQFFFDVVLVTESIVTNVVLDRQHEALLGDRIFSHHEPNTRRSCPCG